jgi:AcrR family transcriptional regulator
MDKPKPYHHGDLRRALIAAGMELLSEGGAAALDLRKVARKAGVSHAAPYRHFEDKRALLVAIAEEGFVQLAEALTGAAAESTPIPALANAYIEFALAEPALMREMFSGLTIDRLAYDSLHSASKVSFGILIAAIQVEQAAGRCIHGNPEKLALVMWSLFHGMAMLLLENQIPMVQREPGGVKGFVSESLDRLVEGLRPRDTESK